jgi:hypothetical protein
MQKNERRRQYARARGGCLTWKRPRAHAPCRTSYARRHVACCAGTCARSRRRRCSTSAYTRRARCTPSGDRPSAILSSALSLLIQGTRHLRAVPPCTPVAQLRNTEKEKRVLSLRGPFSADDPRTRAFRIFLCASAATAVARPAVAAARQARSQHRPRCAESQRWHRSRAAPAGERGQCLASVGMARRAKVPMSRGCRRGSVQSCPPAGAGRAARSMEPPGGRCGGEGKCGARARKPGPVCHSASTAG